MSTIIVLFVLGSIMIFFEIFLHLMVKKICHGRYYNGESKEGRTQCNPLFVFLANRACFRGRSWSCGWGGWRRCRNSLFLLATFEF